MSTNRRRPSEDETNKTASVLKARTIGRWGRPEFMATLGILPPYTFEDVKQAYLVKVRTAHPDVGGDCDAFVRLQKAFERATEYVRSRGIPRSWLGAYVERYMLQQAIIDQVVELGGHVDVESIAWLNDDLGPDFAQITEELVGIHLHGPHVGDDALKPFATNLTPLRSLRVLDLSGTRIGDQGLCCLHMLPRLRSADLRSTRITYHGLVRLPWLSRLERLDVRKTAISQWQRLKLRWFFVRRGTDRGTAARRLCHVGT
ncbi:MAG: hypothetical protein ACC645_02640 [Pirellulales bacterium]